MTHPFMEDTIRKVIFGDNLDVLATMPDESVDLIYIDPPFNTGHAQTRKSIRTIRDESGGDRVGFQGNRYRTVELGSTSYSDSFDDYLGFLEPRFREARRVLKPNGSFFLHVDYREVHYCKVFLDGLFGRESFMNEIIWAYDYGDGPSRDGRRSTTAYSGTPRIPTTTLSTMTRWIESRTWPLDSWVAKRPREARRPRMSGGIRSSEPAGKRRPAIRLRSLWE